MYRGTVVVYMTGWFPTLLHIPDAGAFVPRIIPNRNPGIGPSLDLWGEEVGAALIRTIDG
jgi:hypothetical protein